MIFAIAAHRARSRPRLRRADLVRPRRLHRARRLRGRHSRRAHGINDALIALPVALARRDAVRLPHRHRLPAHQGRLFHHDHARVRADGVLHRQLARALWRRRRPDDPRRDTVAGLPLLESAPRFYYVVLGCSRSATYVLCRALVALALRPRVPRRAGKSAPAWRRSASTVCRFQLVAYVISGGARRPRRASCSPTPPSSSARPTCRGSAPANSSSW